MELTTTSTPEKVQDRLNYYYDKLSRCDEEEQKDSQMITYIKERISFWKKEQLRVEEHLYFGHLDRKVENI